MNVGDLTLKIILETAGADAKAQQFTTTLKNVEGQAGKTNSSLENLSIKVLGFTQGLGLLRDTFGGVISRFKEADNEYQKLINSNRVLESTSKLTGISLNSLKDISGGVKKELQLNTMSANDFTIVLSKLTAKAGESDKTFQSVRAILNLGAAQGLTGEQTLTAIQQAILGIDEGTDKLFQKNPIVIYQEFAEKIGTTAGKLTDQQKAQALLNAVIESGEKVQGTYQQRLTTSAGKQELFNNRVQEAKQKLGEQLNPVMLRAIELADGLLTAYNGLNESQQKLVFYAGLSAGALGKLSPILIPLIGQLLDARKASDALGASKGINNFAGNIIEKLGGGSKVSLVIAGIIASIYAVSEALDRVETRWGNGALDSNGNLMKGKIITDPGNYTFGPGLYGDKLTQKQIQQIENAKTIKQLQTELDSIDNTTLTGESLSQANVRMKELSDQIEKLKKQGLPEEKKQGPASTTAKKDEIFNEIMDLLKEVDDLTKKQAISESGSTMFQIYQEQIDVLNDKIKFLKTNFQDLINTGKLQPGVITTEESGIQPLRGDGSTPMSRFYNSSKTKEQVAAERKKAEDEARKPFEDFANASGAFSNFIGTIGMTDNALGRFAGTISSGINILSSFFQFLNSIGGGNIINSILGTALSFVPGGTVVAGALGGGPAKAGGSGILGKSIGNYFSGGRGSELYASSFSGRVYANYESARMLNAANEAKLKTVYIPVAAVGNSVIKGSDIHTSWKIEDLKIKTETA